MPDVDNDKDRQDFVCDWLIFLKRLEAESIGVLSPQEERQKEKIEVEELRMRSLRSEISRVHSEITEQLVKMIGMSLTAVARLLGVSTVAISKILRGSTQE